MKIKRSEKYKNRLFQILKYIAKDKISASKNFHDSLDKQIKQLPNFPFKFKPSIYFEDENIRDMTFRGYTIIYEIKLNEELIIIMDIFNRNKPVE